eukprot:12883582-Prorocentrum_lima.AAC.1
MVGGHDKHGSGHGRRHDGVRACGRGVSNEPAFEELIPGQIYKGFIRCGSATMGRQQHQHNTSECRKMR